MELDELHLQFQGEGSFVFHRILSVDRFGWVFLVLDLQDRKYDNKYAQQLQALGVVTGPARLRLTYRFHPFSAVHPYLNNQFFSNTGSFRGLCPFLGSGVRIPKKSKVLTNRMTPCCWDTT